jgi:hypothetical protein
MIAEIIRKSYERGSVIIVTLKGTTNRIHIKKGLKQGFPSSQILFVESIDSFIEKLTSKEFRRYGFYWSTENKVTDKSMRIWKRRT